MSQPTEGPLTMGRCVGGRFEVVRAIHHGGQGSVYEAKALEGDEPSRVTLKVLPPELSSDPQIRERLEQQVSKLGSLEDPHHVRLLDVLTEDELLVLLAEYVEGPSLAAVLERGGPLPVNEALDIAIDVCEALDVAHAAEFSHQDLKPSKVLLEGWPDGEPSEPAEGPTSGWRARVRDTGLAEILRTRAEDPARTSDHRGDLRALGAMLYEMLVGEPLDPDDQEPSVRQHAAGQSIPSSVDELVADLIRGEYATARGLAARLRELRRSVSEVEGEETEGDPSVSRLVGTTMKSHRDSALEVHVPRGAKVQVVVPDEDESASQPSQPTRRVSSVPGRAWAGEAGPAERRLWTIVAVLLAVLAVALGVWFGVGG